MDIKDQLKDIPIDPVVVIHACIEPKAGRHRITFCDPMTGGGAGRSSLPLLGGKVGIGLEMQREVRLKSTKNC